MANATCVAWCSHHRRRGVHAMSSARVNPVTVPGRCLSRVGDARMTRLTPSVFQEHAMGKHPASASTGFWRSNGLSLVSIWSRQKDSPQSKPVDARHRQTGTGT